MPVYELTLEFWPHPNWFWSKPIRMGNLIKEVVLIILSLIFLKNNIITREKILKHIYSIWFLLLISTWKNSILFDSVYSIPLVNIRFIRYKFLFDSKIFPWVWFTFIEFPSHWMKNSQRVKKSFKLDPNHKYA